MMAKSKRRAALVEEERSGASIPLDIEAFLERMRSASWQEVALRRHARRHRLGGHDRCAQRPLPFSAETIASYGCCVSGSRTDIRAAFNLSQEKSKKTVGGRHGR